MNIGIGEKVKKLRQDLGLSLNQISDRTNLSATYLSRFERGVVPINVDNLEKVCSALGVEISYFIGSPRNSGDVIIRKYERQVGLKDERCIHYNLSNIEDTCTFLPRYVDLLPQTDYGEGVHSFPHEGEEFVYVLKGILQLWVGGIKYELGAGDSAHYKSTIPHRWVNATSENVQIITLNDTNFYLQI